MYDNPLGYPKGKRGFPWLVYIRKNSKKESLVVFKVIMEDSNDFFGSEDSNGELYLVFYF